MALTLNDYASQYFQEALASENGVKVREYLEDRDIDPIMQRRFGIGYALRGGLVDVLKEKHGATDQQLLDIGLASKKKDGGGVWDFFYNRLMFPIWDEKGVIIAFGGRVLEKDKQPKYLNTRETPLFKKSTTVYGLHLAIPAILKTKTVILVEGYTDVILCHQHGITNVVACLGTAITEAHVQLLAKYAAKIIILTDSDKAGRNSAIRSMDIMAASGLNVAYSSLDEAFFKDAAEYLPVYGAKFFLDAIKKNSRSLVDFAWDTAVTYAALHPDSPRIVTPCPVGFSEREVCDLIVDIMGRFEDREDKMHYASWYLQQYKKINQCVVYTLRIIFSLPQQMQALAIQRLASISNTDKNVIACPEYLSYAKAEFDKCTELTNRKMTYIVCGDDKMVTENYDQMDAFIDRHYTGETKTSKKTPVVIPDDKVITNFDNKFDPNGLVEHPSVEELLKIVIQGESDDPSSADVAFDEESISEELAEYPVEEEVNPF